MRPLPLLPALLIATLLSACGAKEEDIACCAIEPRPGCDSALAAIHVTQAELAILHTSERICPSPGLSAERIRELDANWPAACRQAGVISPAYAMSAGQCLAPEAQEEAPPELTPAN